MFITIGLEGDITKSTLNTNDSGNTVNDDRR